MSISDTSSTRTDELLDRLKNGPMQFSPAASEENVKKPEDGTGNVLEETPESRKPAAAVRASPRNLTQRSLNEVDLAAGDGNKKKRGRPTAKYSGKKKKKSSSKKNA